MNKAVENAVESNQIKSTINTTNTKQSKYNGYKANQQSIQQIQQSKYNGYKANQATAI
jgi:hypothetical protein